MNDADIQDMMEIIYPLNDVYSLMDVDIDPGRIRGYQLFNEIYGSSEEAISLNLTTVRSGGQELKFNNTAGAASALNKAAGDAAAYVKLIPWAAAYLYPSGGTVNYKVIEGTDLLSLHAYGIAIDLNSGANGYWRWVSRAEGEKQIKYYPKGLVQIFENNGFIWGGKWYHFDLFHYEYRPELIIKARCFPGKVDINQPWYQGADLSDEMVKGYIALIDSSLD